MHDWFFKFVFGMIILIFVAQILVYGFLGVKTYDAVKDIDTPHAAGAVIGEFMKGIEDGKNNEATDNQ